MPSSNLPASDSLFARSVVTTRESGSKFLGLAEFCDGFVDLPRSPITLTGTGIFLPSPNEVSQTPP